MTPVLDCAADGLTLLAHGHAEAGEAAGDRRLQTDRAAAWVECTARYAVRTARPRLVRVRRAYSAWCLGSSASASGTHSTQEAGGGLGQWRMCQHWAATDNQDAWRPRGQERAGES